MVRQRDQRLNAPEDALQAKILELNRRKEKAPTRPETLEEAKLRFRMAAHPSWLEMIYARPLPASLAALGLGVVLGVSPRLRAKALELALGALKFR
jgi:hypothetical protein